MKYYITTKFKYKIIIFIPSFWYIFGPLVLTLPSGATCNHGLKSRLVPVVDVLGDVLLVVEPDHEGPPGGGVPDVEPPPSVVAATLTRTRILLLHIHCWFSVEITLSELRFLRRLALPC